MEKEPTNTTEAKQTVKKQLEAEVAKWQTKLDEANVQMNLAAMDARDKLQPHVDQLEQDLGKAQAKWKQFESDTGNAWQEISHGLKMSFAAMQQSFDKAQKHFKKDA